MATREPTAMIVRTPRSAVVFARPAASVELVVTARSRPRRTPRPVERRSPRGCLVDVYA